MKSLTASLAKARFSELLADVERGETVEVTRHGKLIARLVPAADGDRDEKRRAAVAWILENKSSGRRTGISLEDILAARDEGRP